MTGQTAPYIKLTRRNKYGAIAGAGLLWFYNLIFSFTMPVVLPTLMESYGVMALYAVLGGITSLLLCVATPIGGKLGDRFGRRRVCLVVGFARLALMLFCAVPTSGKVFFVIYVAGNFLGGLLSAFPSAILGDVTTAEERPRWFGVFGTINGAALFLGLLCGGVIVDYLGAFSVFLVFAPFGLVALLFLTFCYPNCPANNPAPIDWAGMALLGGGFSCVLAWCAFGGSLFPRGSGVGLWLLPAGAVLLGVLLAVERRAKDPLLNLRLFRLKPFAMSFWAYFLIAPMMCLCSSQLMLFGQKAIGLSALISGTLAVPNNLMFLIFPSLLGTWIARDHRRFRTAFLTCGIAIAAACAIAATWTRFTPVYEIYATMLIFGIGSCFQAVSIQPYMQVSVEPEDMGIASAMILFANSFGLVAFNAAYNIFYNARYAQAIEQGGGDHIAAAMAETFSAMAAFSAVCGAVLILLALILIPRGDKKEERTHVS